MNLIYERVNLVWKKKLSAKEWIGNVKLIVLDIGIFIKKDW